MKNHFVTLAITLIVSTTAFAQNNRSFVSTTGNDANNCTPGNECRSFSRAISVTNSGGDIIAISSGGYGPFTINKSITVMGAPGVVASITAVADGIDIGAGPTDKIVLRGLSINATGSVGDGINASGFRTLAIENCSVVGGATGISVVGPATSYATISDSTVRGSIGLYGFFVGSSVTLLRCRAESNSGSGFHFQVFSQDAFISAVDIVSTGNMSYGIYVACSTMANTATLDLYRSVITKNNGAGVYADGSAGNGAVVVRVADSMVTENGAGGFVQTGSATFNSMGNNFVAGNVGGDTLGTIGTVPAH